MASNLREQVKQHFADYAGANDNLLNECTTICENFNLSAEDLQYKWEALNFNSSATHSELSPLTIESVAALRLEIQRSLTKENMKKPQLRTVATTNMAMVNRARIPTHMLKNVNPGQKLGPLQLKVEHSSGIGGSKTTNAVLFRGPERDESSIQNRLYRYMHEKISERCEALDDRIDEFGELIREHYKISELGDPSSSTHEDTTVVGRITLDSDSQANSKLTEATILLESSRMLASGARVPLRFDQNLKIRGGRTGVGSVSLFPGAIVALRGRNGGGGWFLATEILSLPPPKPSPAWLGLLNPKVDPILGDTPFTMCIACGPYTHDVDLMYKPWRALLKNIETTKPAVVLLVGPFIDVQHPKIRDGDIDTTPANLFKSRLLDPLRSCLDSSPGSIAIMIPSIRDLTSTQAVFPQGELSVDRSDDDARIFFLPNPSNFSINDITFGVSSVDALYHIKRDEYIKRGTEVDSTSPLASDDAGNDPMANLCQHMLQQRSFYPLFPVPMEVSHEVNLSVTHLDGLKMGHDAPDVLIAPSRLKHFSKMVNSTMALNPGFTMKGTYAVMRVAARSAHGVFRERMTTEIIRLEV